MKKVLPLFIFFAFAIVVSRPIVFEAPPTAKVIPAGDVYVVADVNADTPQAGSTDKDEKRQNESVEKRKPTESKEKLNLKINTWPRPDNMKSPIEKKEDQFHLPPDRF